MSDLETYLDRTSAMELANRSLISAPVYAVISLVMLLGTPILTNYGWWAIAEAGLLVLLAIVRIWFSLGFEDRYDRIGERAVVQFSILTALQSLTLGVLAGIVIWQYWATSEVVLTIVLSAGCVAAGTSALSVRRSAHFIFLGCVLVPFGIAVFLVGGLAKAMLILGFLVLMAFLVQDGGQARRTYVARLKGHYEDQLKSRRTAFENRAKKQFLMDIGHEIRTPVNSIIGMTALLLDEKLEPKARDYTRLLRNSCDDLLRLVSTVPGSVKFHAEPHDNELGSSDLRKCVEEVMGLYRYEATQKGIEFTAQLDKIPKSVIFSEEFHLEQVLANLIGNAVRFTHDGSITISAFCREPVDGFMKIRFLVSDTGIGIPEKMLNSLFDPFSADNVRQDGGNEGAGLGLPLSKVLVESMGGNIRIDSKEGQGTEASFTIRVEVDPSVEEPEPDVDQLLEDDIEYPGNLSLSHPHRILVVDDDDIHRKILCIRLAKMGYEADEAEDGQQAIAAIMNDWYDLVFMDLRMPNMGGIQANRWIREHFDKDGKIQVVALTGDATCEVRDICMHDGMDHFVPKPVQLDELRTILTRRSAPEVAEAQ